MDILICKIKYNEKYNELPHQHFVGFYNGECIELYVITSIKSSKRKFIIQNFDSIFILEKSSFNLKLDSYIDCSVCYKLELDNTIDIMRLDNRYINDGILKASIFDKINKLKADNIHKTILIDIEEFKKRNLKCCKMGSN